MSMLFEDIFLCTWPPRALVRVDWVELIVYLIVLTDINKINVFILADFRVSYYGVC